MRRCPLQSRQTSTKQSCVVHGKNKVHVDTIRESKLPSMNYKMIACNNLISFSFMPDDQKMSVCSRSKRIAKRGTPSEVQNRGERQLTVQWKQMCSVLNALQPHQLCRSFYQTGTCPYAKRCVFLHSSSSNGNPLQKEGTRPIKTPLLSRVGCSTALKRTDSKWKSNLVPSMM